MKQWTDESTKEALAMRCAGYSMRDIAEALGVTKNSVIGKLNRVKRRNEKLSNRKVQSILLQDKPKAIIYKNLIDLKANECRWPIGNKAPYKFCGQKTDGHSYCTEHRKTSLRTSRPKNHFIIPLK